MTLKEVKPGGEEVIHPDGGLLPRAQLAKAFGCSPFAIERLWANANVNIIEQDTKTGRQKYMSTDHFPRLINAVQKQGDKGANKKIVSERVDTSKDFRVRTVSGVLFEYTHPQ